ncbi:formate dehydrogenase accessory sulfurtransferase FdhD [candidate division TA06 bacterium]|uniref:Formate dehydrogenase accessory sulfurtransferase FdhD n=1 Tax=candidate division TA06 bacterium TaxID=2250710 RepID=A0A660SC24_UNCT6|nr:MAG: formate dehydrogenase accessory sulfurtransferase FdhD [candidate division TA06 bacterium]
MEFEILRVSKNDINRIKDSVIEESWINILVNNMTIFSTTCLFEAVKEFTYGFLRTEGIIQSLEDIKDTIIKDSSIFISIPTFKVYKRYKGEGAISLLPLKYHIRFSSELIINIGKHFDSIGKLYRSTGGSHIAALYNLKGECLIHFEDINRRNAADKIAGYMLLNNINADDKILMTSGRMASDIIIKVRRAGIPIIISKSAPTNRGIETAHKLNVTMVGFLRENRFNLYNNFHNLILN